ncbi:MAG: hypothetical protein HQM11_21035, partial [SAR324 cluster bacterium]|nr:hypothetical protein [SAR324 cluster bacterium]
TWLSGLKLTPSLRYELAGLSTGESSGTRSQTGGDYSLNLSATYDFREQQDELKRLNKDTQGIIADATKLLQNMQISRSQFEYLKNELDLLKKRTEIIRSRVEKGLSKREELWDMEESARKLNNQVLTAEVQYKANRFLLSVMVLKKREQLLTMIDTWEGFE